MLKRAFLYTLIAGGTINSLIALAPLCYIAAYNLYVPNPVVSVEVDYDIVSRKTRIDAPDLRAGVGYEFGVQIKLPRDQYNLDLGNFMVTATSDSNSRRRPAILPYASPLLANLDAVVFSPLYLTNYATQSSNLVIPMFKWHSNDPTVTVAIDRNIHFETISAVWTVQLQGVRWLMFHYKVLSFIVGTLMFIMVEILTMAAATFYVLHKRASQDASDEASSEFNLYGHRFGTPLSSSVHKLAPLTSTPSTSRPAPPVMSSAPSNHAFSSSVSSDASDGTITAEMYSNYAPSDNQSEEFSEEDSEPLRGIDLLLTPEMTPDPTFQSEEPLDTPITTPFTK
uniref:ARAD1C36608p n=1 Tax=Blastobotrys adeninivorans TaxID=409370 RepID=A0A060T9A8_BLAAD